MIIVVMGVSGCGKTTVGRALAARLGWPFHDADDHHPPANVEKMGAGLPLTDADRAGWLDALRTRVVEPALAGQPTVLACSALRQTYRDRLARPVEPVRFVHLRGSIETIRQRLAARRGHYMPASLLESQFAALEEPGDALLVPLDLAPERAAAFIVEKLQLGPPPT